MVKNYCCEKSSDCTDLQPGTFSLDTCKKVAGCKCYPALDRCAYGHFTARWNPCKGPYGTVRFTGTARNLEALSADGLGYALVLSRSDCDNNHLRTWFGDSNNVVPESSINPISDCETYDGNNAVTWDVEYTIPSRTVLEDLQCGNALLAVDEAEPEGPFVVFESPQAHGIVCLTEDSYNKCAFKPTKCCKPCKKYETGCCEKKSYKKSSKSTTSYSDSTSYSCKKCNKRSW